jgi:pimeloyl-ACP methyl ester carboxylesterase
MKLIYVHGINESTSKVDDLKLDWDMKLFGGPDAESVFAFWADLSVYQEGPKVALSFQDKLLCEIFHTVCAPKLLLDCDHYFYNTGLRTAIQQRLIELLPTDKTPFVLLSHSLGTVIAYEVLLQMRDKLPDLNCVQLITVGSPLGVGGLQAEIRRVQNIPEGELPVPTSIKRWANYSDWLDPVAAQHFLNKHFDDSFVISDEIVFNPMVGHVPPLPHSIDGYLTTKPIRERVVKALAL